MIKLVSIILTAGLLAALRVRGCKTQAFQAAAHLFVGGLFGAHFAGSAWPATLGVALAVSAVELAVFVRDRLPKRAGRPG